MKKRKDSFFGIHCDFHAKPSKCDTLGGTLREDDVREICRTLKPDFIQIDCKGHPGWASYPSSLGNAMPHFDCDTLALWRKVTREENVALYMHYSGIFDIKYCEEHPEECTVLADGSTEMGTTRLGGRYVDELLIPQLSELAEVYGVDGVWVDGECWRARPDFREESLRAFEKDTGIDLCGNIPATPKDTYYHEYREYYRGLFLKYVSHYVDTLHEKFPNLQITSNWAFSDYMPERVSVNVDYLSGDFTPSSSCYSARYAGRALAQQGLPWDLMSWNFRWKVGDKSACVAKHPVQIMQEAAEVISLGGAYQNYVMQNNDGSPHMHELMSLKEVSEFIRARKDYCFRGKIVPQAALLLSTYDRKREMSGLYSRNGSSKISGLTALLTDAGQSLEIVSEHTLSDSGSYHKMIVVPPLFCGLEDDTVSRLMDYAEDGGNLVLIGKSTCQLFSDKGLPFTVTELDEYFEAGKMAYDNGGDTGHGSSGDLRYRPYPITLDERSFGVAFSPVCFTADNAKVHALVSKETYSKKQPVALTIPYGMGSVTAIGFDIGSQYRSASQYLHRYLIKDIANSLYTPLFKVESALGLVEIVCLSKDGRLMLQLINGNGQHTNSASSTEDFIPPALDLRLSVALDHSPKRLLLQPEGRELPFEYKDGRAYFEIGRLDVHSIVEVIE